MSAFVAYYRVSRERQRQSGLGLEAQRDRVRGYVAGLHGNVAAEFTEVESGKVVTRPQLDLAIAKAVETGATLIVAKLDRMARNTRYLLKILDSGVPITFCDLPQVPDGALGRFIITQMASVAEFERGLISERTKAALDVARSAGKQLGTHGKVLARRRRAEANDRARRLRHDVLRQYQVDLADMSAREAALFLNDKGFPTPTGRAWGPTPTQRLLERMRHDRGN